jgi:hypothetical protein
MAGKPCTPGVTPTAGPGGPRLFSGDLARRWDRNHGGSIAIPATYLESILTLR